MSHGRMSIGPWAKPPAAEFRNLNLPFRNSGSSALARAELSSPSNTFTFSFGFPTQVLCICVMCHWQVAHAPSAISHHPWAKAPGTWNLEVGRCQIQNSDCYLPVASCYLLAPGASQRGACACRLGPQRLSRCPYRAYSTYVIRPYSTRSRILRRDRMPCAWEWS